MALNVAQLLTPPAGSKIGAVQAGSGVTIDNSGVMSVAGAGGVSRINAGNNITLSANTGSINISLTTAPAGTNFPSGTVMPFSQSSAPTNWTKNTDFDNGMLRIVSGSGGGTGGSQDFTSAFQSYSPTASSSNATYSINSNVGNTNITPSGGGDLAGGRAVAAATTLTSNQSGNHRHNVQQTCYNLAGTQSLLNNCGGIQLGEDRPTTFVGGGGAHQHSFAAPVSTNFTGNTSSHNHPLSSSGNINTISISMNNINLAVKYRDLILCRRN